MLFNYGDEIIVCGICEQVIEDIEDLSIDHIIPLSRGGSNEDDNLQPAHRRCNWQKGNRMPGEENIPARDLVNRPVITSGVTA